MSVKCRDLFDQVGLVSVRVQHVRLNVGTCSNKSGYCRDMLGDVGLVTGLVWKGRINVGTCSSKSA